jgi:hypothetical protein
MRWLLGLLLLILPFSVMAQDDDGNIEVPVTISAAEIVTTEDGLAVEIDGSMGTGCDFPADVVQTVEDDQLIMTISQLVPATVFCPMVLVEYEATIPLELESGVMQLIVNETTTLEIPAAQAAGERETMVRVPHLVEAAELDDNELTISGFIPDGCEYPTQVDVIPQADDWVIVALYREVPKDEICTEIALEFTETVTLETIPTYFELNDYAAIVTDDGLESGVRQALRVRGVTTTENGLTVRGSFEDACELRPLQAVTRDQRLLMVDIFRIQPQDFDDPCTDEPREIMQLTVDLSAVSPGDYFYMVNRQRSGSVTVETSRPQPTIVYQVLEEVDATFDDGDLVVTVSGYAPDSCETDIKVDRRFEDEELYIDIYRELPPGVRCPGERVPYDNMLIFAGRSEIETVIVNEIRVDVAD